MDYEFQRLVKQNVFDFSVVRDWNQVAEEARRQKKTVHVGRVFGICTEKNSELPKHLRSWEGPYVFQGNDVRDEYGLQTDFPTRGVGHLLWLPHEYLMR